MDMQAVPGALAAFLDKGGVAIWVIAALSVATLALILWKTWRLMVLGAWAGARAERAVALWQGRDRDGARKVLAGRLGLRARLVRAAMAALEDGLPETAAREETTRVARGLLAEARTGLRALELIATIAPLLGLLGTVLGMIEAFQTLEESGTRADPAALAGGIWEALLTTAAGMAVAIPAALALGWFESVAARAQHDMEDLATRLFLAAARVGIQAGAPV
ncbi:flagellar motor protein MotA [Maritimibacter sp. 55A14]|uniref:MotA/TolQ/ExbB proton channel family protein n=1 Tax=Maritimibacter sp. 55A14 TaxID=2174844 RepID=UPI000D608CB2|nr:MotA/TolQ/ExbB proton channel family protein [Maritimibacter sp. 55A14]PWE33259.1 flagellar motor protein MotA [Maritimibacter sp. 55A14]